MKADVLINICLSAYLGSLVLALLMTPAVIRLARRLGIVHVPGARHIHTRPVSHIGGVAIFVSTVSVSLAVLWFSHVIAAASRDVLPQLRVLLVGAGFMFTAGLIDDVKPNGLRPRTKLLAQIAAAVLVCAAGIRIESVVVTDSLTLDFGWLSWPLTLLWIVGITNAVNLSDGLDGLAGGLSAAACAAIAVFAAFTGQWAVVTLMLALLGGVSGFLFFNFNPAKIFMGDCGSMFLGFTIGSAGVFCCAHSPALAGLALPALALGVPIFDTLFSMLRRFLERRSIFSADRSHFHHRLIDLGLTQRQAVLAIYGVTLLTAGIGTLMMVSPKGHALMFLFCALLLLLLVFQMVGPVRLGGVIAGLRRRRRIIRRERQERRSFEDATLHFRRAVTFDQWWQAISTAADKMDFGTVDLPLVNRDGTRRALTWRHNGQNFDPAADGLMQVHVPVRDRRSGSSLRLRIEIHKNGSLESAGRRVALFTRLLEEYDIVSLPADGRGTQPAPRRTDDPLPVSWDANRRRPDAEE